MQELGLEDIRLSVEIAVGLGLNGMLEASREITLHQQVGQNYPIIADGININHIEQ